MLLLELDASPRIPVGELVSYADFIALLFAFFVVLYAFAKADQKKQIEVSQSIDSAFGSLRLFPGADRPPSGGCSSVNDTNKAAMPMSIVMSE